MRFRLLLSFIFVFSAVLPARAESPQKAQIALLTSIKSEGSIWHSADWSIVSQLEDDFRSAFAGSGYELLVIRDATAVQLAAILQSPRVIGLFWVSHAAPAGGADDADLPFSSDSLIVDESGIDVKAVFQKIQPGMRWLSVIGCKAQPILDGYKNDGFYARNPLLQIQSYTDLVDAEPGLIYAMNLSVPALGDPSASKSGFQRVGKADPNPHGVLPSIVAPSSLLSVSQAPLAVQSGLALKVTRFAEAKDAPEALLFANHETFLGVLPKLTAPGSQTLEVVIPSGLKPDKLEIVLSDGKSAVDREPVVLGKLRLDADGLDPASWSVFVDDRGVPIGINSNIYSYTCAIPNKTDRK